MTTKHLGRMRPRIRPWQFAGVRTNAALEIIGEPLTLYAQPDSGSIASSGSGAGHRHHATVGCTKSGLPEAAVHRTAFTTELAQPKDLWHRLQLHPLSMTRSPGSPCGAVCGIPTAREWQNGNSRWDLLDVTAGLSCAAPCRALSGPCATTAFTSFRT